MSSIAALNRIYRKNTRRMCDAAGSVLVSIDSSMGPNVRDQERKQLDPGSYTTLFMPLPCPALR